ncbi:MULTISPECIES: CPBP family intramembrane glutamic endopeptidase [Staphylococcus]|uniref:CPBP family intramembrane metalloprotease n=1 Tax=Staphylococcus aureus TaxID=1280 RepID=A0A4V1DXG6_STAAU|nr:MULTISPECIES: CPBP family intramembrane glutamic endopeptidase [Staphylococcus]ACY12642.1 caax amino protease family [Staphylococcus aureus subsp. aureus ED98]AXG28516.1 CAAX protease family protein [Staphylococcus aureus]AXG31521.1 CAAX protease family protein [Staphylococcus aureus]AYK27790.1 CPBP family intramembrane metalloprotease [Staphylococcus aureus]AYK27904.1 CPBP family intramembrane metalloprotease [Staphylococcus aureus]
MKKTTIYFVLYFIISALGFGMLKKLGIEYNSLEIAVYALPMMIILSIFVYSIALNPYQKRKSSPIIHVKSLEYVVPLVILCDILIILELLYTGNFRPILVAQLFLTFLIGFSEEFFFRKYIIEHILTKYKSKLLALITSSILFGLLHMANTFGGLTIENAASQSMSATGVGLLYGLIYIFTKKIWMLVLLHMNVDFALFSSVINQSYLQAVPAFIVDIILIFTVLKIIMYILKSIKSKNNKFL